VGYQALIHTADKRSHRKNLEKPKFSKMLTCDEYSGNTQIFTVRIAGYPQYPLPPPPEDPGPGSQAFLPSSKDEVLRACESSACVKHWAIVFIKTLPSKKMPP
jgi:hypothetical protein